MQSFWDYSPIFCKEILQCTAGKFTGEFEKSASSDEVGMKSTKNVLSNPSWVAEKSSLPSVVVLNFWKIRTSGP